MGRKVFSSFVANPLRHSGVRLITCAFVCCMLLQTGLAQSQAVEPVSAVLRQSDDEVARAEAVVEELAELLRALGDPSERDLGVCGKVDCSPDVLSGIYRVVEGSHAGSELKLQADGRYWLQVETELAPLVLSGRWNRQSSVLLLEPTNPQVDAVKLVPREASARTREALLSLLSDLGGG